MYISSAIVLLWEVCGKCAFVTPSGTLPVKLFHRRSQYFLIEFALNRTALGHRRMKQRKFPVCACFVDVLEMDGSILFCLELKHILTPLNSHRQMSPSTWKAEVFDLLLFSNRAYRSFPFYAYPFQESCFLLCIWRRPKWVQIKDVYWVYLVGQRSSGPVVAYTSRKMLLSFLLDDSMQACGDIVRDELTALGLVIV